MEKQTLTNENGVWEIQGNVSMLIKPSDDWKKANQLWFEVICTQEISMGVEFNVTIKPLFEPQNITILVDGMVVFTDLIDTTGCIIPLIFNEVGYKKIQIQSDKGNINAQEIGVMVNG